MIKCHTYVPGTREVQDRLPSRPSLRVNFGKTVGMCDAVRHKTREEYCKTDTV